MSVMDRADMDVWVSRLDPRLRLYEGTANIDRAKRLNLTPTVSATSGPALRKGVSIVILTRDAPDLIIPLLDRLISEQGTFAHDGLVLEIVVGDTGTIDPSVLNCYRRLPDFVRVCRGLEYNFSANNNELFRRWVTCEATLFLNNDVIFPSSDSPVRSMYNTLVSQKLDILGAYLFFPDGGIQHCGIQFVQQPETRGLPFHVHAREYLVVPDLPPLWASPGVTGACLMIRSQMFHAVGGFDEAYFKEIQDIDLCLAAHRVGGKIAVGNFGHIIHIENGTRPKGEEHWEDRRLFLRRWCCYISEFFC